MEPRQLLVSVKPSGGLQRVLVLTLYHIELAPVRLSDRVPVDLYHFVVQSKNIWFNSITLDMLENLMRVPLFLRVKSTLLCLYHDR